MTAREFAQAINRPYPTVAMWLREGLIPEATSLQLGGMRVWQVPVNIVTTFEHPKIGRPKKAAATTTKAGKPKRASKKASKRTE